MRCLRGRRGCARRAGTARLYATLKPRIQDAYRELGETSPDFDRTFERAIRELLKTPVVDATIALELEDRVVRVRRPAAAVPARRPAPLCAWDPETRGSFRPSCGKSLLLLVSRSMYTEIHLRTRGALPVLAVLLLLLSPAGHAAPAAQRTDTTEGAAPRTVSIEVIVTDKQGSRSPTCVLVTSPFSKTARNRKSTTFS